MTMHMPKVTPEDLKEMGVTPLSEVRPVIAPSEPTRGITCCSHCGGKDFTESQSGRYRCDGCHVTWTLDEQAVPRGPTEPTRKVAWCAHCGDELFADGTCERCAAPSEPTSTETTHVRSIAETILRAMPVAAPSAPEASTRDTFTQSIPPDASYLVNAAPEEPAREEYHGRHPMYQDGYVAGYEKGYKTAGAQRAAPEEPQQEATTEGTRMGESKAVGNPDDASPDHCALNPTRAEPSTKEPMADTMVAGREMDALVAEKVMGWKPGTPCKDEYSDTPTEERDTHWQCRKCGLRGQWGDPGWEEHDEQPLSYSTDIAAAWLVVEKMRSGGRKFIIEALKPEHTELWYAAFSATEDLSGYEKSKALEPTAPLAICLAALEAVKDFAPATGQTPTQVRP